MSVNDAVAQIKDLNMQNIALQKRLGQAEQEVIRQRGAIEQSAQVVAALSLGAADSTQRKKLAALKKESTQMLEEVRLCSETLQEVRKSTVETRKLSTAVFSNNEKDFVKWSSNIKEYMSSVRETISINVLADAVDGATYLNINEEEALDWRKFKESYFKDDEDELDEINEAVYVCLKEHVKAESLDIVRSAGKGQGLEAWRRLNRRWDPMATGFRKQLWEGIQSLGRARFEDLIGSIERLEDLFGMYLARIKAEGDVADLDEDTQMACLESLLPKEMEKHVQLNKAKLTNYFLLRAEIIKEIKRYKPPGLEVMETDNKSREKGHGYWTKGKGKGKDPKGKGKGKEVKGKYKCYEVLSGKGATDCRIWGYYARDCPMQNTQCHNCKKWGHYAKDCWAPKVKIDRGGKGKGVQSKGKGVQGKGKGVQVKGKGKSKSSTARLDLGSLDWNADGINSDGCLARLAEAEQNFYDANYTLRYYGLPVYDPCVFDPDKSDGEEFDSESDISVAAERIVRVMKTIRETSDQPPKGNSRGRMPTWRRPGWNGTATVMMGGLMGAQAIQEDETWRSVSGVWTQSPMVMMCMVITAIIVILIGHRMTKVFDDWLAKRTRVVQDDNATVVDVLCKDELFRKVVEFSGFEDKYWKLAAIHRDCLWHRDSLLSIIAEERASDARARETTEIGTAERDHVGVDTGFRIPAEGDIRCSREWRQRLIDEFGERGRHTVAESVKQRRIQQVKRDQQAWRDQRAKVKAKRQPRRQGEELGVNTSESSSEEGCPDCAMFEAGADTTREVQPLVSDGGKGKQQVARTAQEMFQAIDDNPNLPPECRGEGGELIQLTREQCHEMLVPDGSWYRGGIVVFPGYPKGFISKGHTIPKGHSKGVVNKGKGQGGAASNADSLHYKGGGTLSTLEFSKDVEAGKLLDKGCNSSSNFGSDSWLRMNLDTGAAIHAFPQAMYVENDDITEMITRSGHYVVAELEEEEYKDTEIWYTTASGQEIPDMGQMELNLEDDEGRQLQMMSNVTSVHKCLVSASKLCIEGEQEIWLNSAGGFVLPTKGPIAKGLALEYERLVKIHGDREVLPVYLDRGVYNVYFKLKKKAEVSTSRGEKRKSTAASAGSTDEKP